MTSSGPTRIYDHETDLDALVREPDHVCHLGWAIVPTRVGRLLRQKLRVATKTLCGIPWAETGQHHARSPYPGGPACHECGRTICDTCRRIHDRRIHDA